MHVTCSAAKLNSRPNVNPSPRALIAPALLVLEGPQGLASRLLSGLQVCLPLFQRLGFCIALQQECTVSLLKVVV